MSKLKECLFTCFYLHLTAFKKLTTETLEQGVKYIQSWPWTYFISCSSVSIVNFEHVNAGWACTKEN